MSSDNQWRSQTWAWWSQTKSGSSSPRKKEPGPFSSSRGIVKVYWSPYFSVSVSFSFLQTHSACQLSNTQQESHSWPCHFIVWHFSNTIGLHHSLLSVWPLSSLYWIVTKSYTSASSYISLFSPSALHRHWLFPQWPQIISADHKSSRPSRLSVNSIQ